MLYVFVLKVNVWTLAVAPLTRVRHSQPKTTGLVLGRWPLGAILHSSNEPGELSQWLCHEDSIINIVLVIVIIIIIIIIILVLLAV